MSAKTLGDRGYRLVSLQRHHTDRAGGQGARRSLSASGCLCPLRTGAQPGWEGEFTETAAKRTPLKPHSTTGGLPTPKQGGGRQEKKSK